MTKMLLPLLELTIINFLSTNLNSGITLKKPQIENAKNISSQKDISLKFPLAKNLFPQGTEFLVT